MIVAMTHENHGRMMVDDGGCEMPSFVANGWKRETVEKPVVPPEEPVFPAPATALPDLAEIVPIKKPGRPKKR
jgi:hypothetical protein